MSVFTTQGYKFRLVAGIGPYTDRTQLDLYSDEQILVSNNITDLFDIGSVPGTFTKNILLPGTKKNNQFFEQFYDISVEEPDLFSTNQKVEAYIDFDGVYLANGYIQLLKVNVFENKFVDSYEVILFGIVSNFSVDANRHFLTDLSNLAVYNHTASLAIVSSSWQGNLYSGSIRYALTDSGTDIYYTIEQDTLGIDEIEGALSLQQFKPAIKAKLVWDGIFDFLGYTYTGSFMNDPIWDNMYLLLNNNLKYPVVPSLPLETLDQFKAEVITGSFLDLAMTNNTYRNFPANSLLYDYSDVVTLGDPLAITLDKSSTLKTRMNLVFRVSGSGAGSGMPAFEMRWVDAATPTTVYATQSLDNVNNYLNILRSARSQTTDETFSLPFDFTIPFLPGNTKINFQIKYTVQGTNNFTVTLNPQTARTYSNVQVRALNQGLDFEFVNIPANMPYGTSGIKLIDFIRGIQKKFNLIIYEDKTYPKQFIVETFNTWYKQGEYKDFNKYINLNEKVEFIPASSLAVNKLDFTDIQDTDYVSTLWQRTYNRTFGQAILIDTGSYFSQGEFKVGSTFAAGQLGLVPGSVATGSFLTQTQCRSYNVINLKLFSDITFKYVDCTTGLVVNERIENFGESVTVCSRVYPYDISDAVNTLIYDYGVCTPSSPSTASGSRFPVYIPYYISNDEASPAARVMPRLMFWNGLLNATPYWIQGYGGLGGGSDFNNDFNNDFGPQAAQTLSSSLYYQYPYFDNYSVVSGSTIPTSGSYSLLFNNETPVFGQTPDNNLIDSYWTKYLNLLYNPRTRLVNAKAVIPLADYFQMELNDIVQFRSNYYHLRAINDYNLTTGECDIQLLGPVIKDAVSNIVFGTPTP